jgi:vitamin B12 transporter
LYESRSVILDGFNKYNFNNELALIVGANYQFHDMLSQTPFATIENEAAKFNILDGYTTLVYNSSFGLNVNAGVRLNTHSQYGNNVVYNINPSYNFKTSFPLKVLASYSTAFITPSLYQLYSEYGNSDLNPEENATVEAGFETELLNKKIKLSAVGFYRDQNDAIDFFYNPDTFEAYYVNVDGKSKAKGVETTVSVALTEKLSLNGNYTFTQVDKVLDRLIPKHKVNASIDFQPTKRTLLNLNYQYLDARNDAFYNGTTFTVDTIQLGSYQLLNALAKYELIQNRLTVFGTVTNIFNEEFVENAGYSTRGRNFRLGVNIVL